MTRSRVVKVAFFLAGGVVMGLFSGCLVPLLPVGLRLAGNAIIDVLLGLTQ